MLTFFLCVNRMPFDRYVKYLLGEAARHNEVKTKLLEWRNGIFLDESKAKAYIREMMGWQELAELADTSHWSSSTNIALAFNRYVAMQGGDVWFMRTKRILVMPPRYEGSVKRTRYEKEGARSFYLV